MNTADAATTLLQRATDAYINRHFEWAEYLLMQGLRLQDTTPEQKEQFYELLSTVFTSQGSYGLAVHWYARMLQSKSERMLASDHELGSCINNYRALMRMQEARSAQPVATQRALAYAS
jgi:hypothetical protein